jgi:hypothetical protein
MKTKNPEPAGRNPWPIAIVAYFIVFISFIVGFIVFATRQKMDLVREDYYDQEIRFQKQIDRVTRTQSISTQIVIRYDARQGAVTVELPKEQAGQHPTGTVVFYRPSNASLDETHELTLDANGGQRLDTRKLKAGLWTVRVEWSLAGQDYFYDKQIVVKGGQS